MTDIVQRLRTENTMLGYYDAPGIQQDAADEIERLREALEEVRPLVLGANHSKDRYPKARAALGEEK